MRRVLWSVLPGAARTGASAMQAVCGDDAAPGSRAFPRSRQLDLIVTLDLIVKLADLTTTIYSTLW
jgi:hypothetical protein